MSLKWSSVQSRMKDIHSSNPRELSKTAKEGFETIKNMEDEIKEMIRKRDHPTVRERLLDAMRMARNGMYWIINGCYRSCDVYITISAYYDLRIAAYDTIDTIVQAQIRLDDSFYILALLLISVAVWLISLAYCYFASRFYHEYPPLESIANEAGKSNLGAGGSSPLLISKNQTQTKAFE